MKTMYQILISGLICAGVIAAPCFAEERLLSSPILMVDHLTDQPAEYLLAENHMEGEAATDEEEDLDYLDEEEELPEIADPFESFNRIAFQFNDKLYFWVLKPVATGYSKVVPEPVRISVRNFFNNLATPIRFVNNLLQFKIKSAGNELFRFGFNTTLGVLGLFDAAKYNNLGMPMQDEDLGQTFGAYGAGPGFYINWPILGPSSLRDTVGFVGDMFLDPVSYVDPTIDRIAIKAGDQINRTSLRLEDYEKLKVDMLDPYSGFRDIYHQYRENKIDK
jgi:phospholipid-binding lipoprotein MlaA